MLIELRQALISYQDYHMLLLTLSGLLYLLRHMHSAESDPALQARPAPSAPSRPTLCGAHS